MVKGYVLEIIVPDSSTPQIGRPERDIEYRIGRCGKKLYLIIDGVVPKGGTTTKKWISLETLRPLFAAWKRENQETPDLSSFSRARFGNYFKSALPKNRTMSGRVVAVLRKHDVLIAGDLVRVYLPEYPRDFYFRVSILNPRKSFDAFLRELRHKAPVKGKKFLTEKVPVKEFFSL